MVLRFSVYNRCHSYSEGTVVPQDIQSSLIDWAKKTSPAWAQQRIHSADDLRLKDIEHGVLQHFVTFEHHRYDNICMSDIIGQEGHYAGQTWLEALLNPTYKPHKMARAIIDYENTPGYYFDNGRKETMYLKTLDGKSPAVSG